MEIVGFVDFWGFFLFFSRFPVSFSKSGDFERRITHLFKVRLVLLVFKQKVKRTDVGM